MYVKFDELKFKNILSYGNDDNVLKFENGMILISGKNGNGKCLRGNTQCELLFPSDDVKDLFGHKNTIKDVYDFYWKHPEYIGMIEVRTQYGFRSIEFADITARDSEIIRIELVSGKFVECSPDHLIYSDRIPNVPYKFADRGTWTKAKELSLSDSVLTKDGYERIKSVNKLDFKEDLYDFQVADVSEFYSNGIVSHNSTMIDALSFCLYGKPYRKIKINELINRRNKKKLYTECSFFVGEDKYTIVRTLNPNSVEIFKNGDASEKLSSKKLNQEEINKIIGIDYNLFRQIIALSINYNKSFLALEIADKRDIIESIFNIKIFAEMLKKLKQTNTTLKVQNQLNLNNITILESTIKTLKTQIENIEKTRLTFDTDKNITIERYKNTLNEKETQYKNLLASNKKLKEQIDKTNKLLIDVDFHSEVSDTNSIMKFAEKKFNDATEKIKLFNENTVCPFCTSELTDEHKKLELNRLNEEIKNAKAEACYAKTKRSELTQQYQQNEKIKKQIAGFENEMNSNKIEIQHIKTEAKRIASEITNEENRTFNFDDSSLKIEFESKKELYAKTFKEYSDTQEELKYNDFAVNILSDQGIKSFFFKKLVPILNNKINYYLDMFDLPVKIEFNEMMEENITVLANKESVSYMSFSEGEKKRIDISIMLSFIDTTKAISNWNSNLLVFDEILDSSTDSDGLDKIMGAIKQMTLDDMLLSCYIISHRENDHENYTNKIIIKKIGGFSSIKQ